MSDYVIVGKKGTGKSKYAVQKIHEYLGQGRRVATNLDIDLVAMCSPQSRCTVVRVPDKPRLSDLEMIGLGNEDVDEDKNGGLFLDECATWLNARTFNDKDRQGVINFGIHGRKLGWDTWYICQHLDQIDKQVRSSLIEYVVRCVRLDKVKLPVIGGLLAALSGGAWGTLPKLHFASTRLLESPDIVIDREFYKAKFYESCYNTRQIFRDWVRDPADSRFKDETFAGPYSVLSAWHLKGRYETVVRRSLLSRLRALFKGVQRPVVQLKPKNRIVQLIMALPKNERIKHFRRFQAAGAI